MPKFRLTFEAVTEESAQDGEAARQGWVPDTLEIPDDNGPDTPCEFGLRDAVNFLLNQDGAGPVEADCCPVSRRTPPRWFTYGGAWGLHGEAVRVSLHLPESITVASRLRLARLLGCYGVRA